ncbi:MAG: glycosyltransferase [Candidatus Thermoplasmatota archaeon]|nr:glycosyltransferase [Candidatus Thermoplasmatota archaeon]
MRNNEKTNYKVTVVVPVSDHQNNIERCLRSIIDQSFKDHEIMIIDGTSTDSVEKVVSKFQKKFKGLKLFHEEFFSHSALRNRGIMGSGADIIILTDPDCEAPCDWIERMIVPIISGEEIVQGNAIISSGRYWSHLHQLGIERLMKASSEVRYIDHIDLRNIAFRRSILLDMGMFDRHVKHFEDLDIRLRTKRYGLRIRYLHDSLVSQYVDLGLRDLLSRWVEMGKWTYLQYTMNRPGKTKRDDSLFGILGIRGYLLFVPGSLLVLFRLGISHFISEIICGTALRTGIILGVLDKERFLRSIRAKYD